MKHLFLYEDYAGERYPTVYHGSPFAFREFSYEHLGKNTKHDPKDVGFHFSDELATCMTYSKAYKIRIEHKYAELVGVPHPHPSGISPQLVTAKLLISNPLCLEYSKEINRDSIRHAEFNGYDAIIARISGFGLEYVVFDTDNIDILRIDPLVYDLETDTFRAGELIIPGNL